MSRKNTSRRLDLRKSVFKNKLTFPAFFLIVILAGYLIFHNISSEKIIEAKPNNLNIIEDNADTVNNIDHSTDNIDMIEAKKSSIAEAVNSSDKSEPKTTLINDNRGVPVLYYHSVRESADNEVTITPKLLRTELQYIRDEGYVTLTLSELKAYILNNSPIPTKSILITFDDGYMDNYDNAFPILKDLNMVATIFCITSNLDGSYYLSKEAIDEMSHYGIDIESHTVNHPKLNKMTYDEQLSEFIDSKKTLESITGKKIDSIAYPFGDFNDDSIKAAKDAGYTLGFTTKKGLSDRDDNPLKLDRIYISSKYDMDTFKEILNKTKK
ncbi:deacetylase [Clostridium gelidum]|uniref:Deacetylase n=1 Tax=Clostridium gelidum TaxID=704125 RepID=A0ABN6IUX5_9CLOT|nr:polysaccharide deacetylase family protein [Clostridium gelidum]BCZ44249.1 deacetylase [Clostridium gelidum]